MPLRNFPVCRTPCRPGTMSSDRFRNGKVDIFPCPNIIDNPYKNKPFICSGHLSDPLGATGGSRPPAVVFHLPAIRQRQRQIRLLSRWRHRAGRVLTPQGFTRFFNPPAAVSSVPNPQLARLPDKTPLYYPLLPEDANTSCAPVIHLFS